jgi:hypothetical protein
MSTEVQESCYEAKAQEEGVACLQKKLPYFPHDVKYLMSRMRRFVELDDPRGRDLVELMQVLFGWCHRKCDEEILVGQQLDPIYQEAMRKMTDACLEGRDYDWEAGRP